MRQLPYLLAFCFIATWLAGCGGHTTVTPPSSSNTTWTVLVYMAANNSLDAAALLNFQQMAQVAFPAGTANAPVTILVQMTRAGGNGTGTDNWSGTRRYIVQQNTSSTIFPSSELLNNMGSSVDSGNPQTLQQFIAWGQGYAPATHYLVDVWDHGSGWDPVNDATSTKALHRAICYDQTTGSVMTDASLSSALTALYPIDIVAMDDCLMSCAEVAYQIRGQANYLVASEDSTPAEGFNYTDLISKLVSQYGTLTPSAYAQYIASDSLQYWNNNAGLTMTALNLSKMNAVASALNTFSLRLVAVDNSYATQLLTSWRACPPFDASAGSYMQDLTQYATQVAANVPDSQLQADAQALIQAIASSVVWTGGETGTAYGMSIYSPPGAVYFNSATSAGGITAVTSYAALALAQSTAWEQWLEIAPGL
jgi:hypothetical protein